VEGVGVLLAEIAIDAADGQVHLGQPPGIVFGISFFNASFRRRCSIEAGI